MKVSLFLKHLNKTYRKCCSLSSGRALSGRKVKSEMIIYTGIYRSTGIYRNIQEYRNIQKYRNTGIQDYRNIQEYRNTGIQKYRNTGIQEYRNTEYWVNCYRIGALWSGYQTQISNE